jgi:hypothetical protein
MKLIVILRNDQGTLRYTEGRYEDFEDNGLRVYGSDDKLIDDFHFDRMLEWRVVDQDSSAIVNNFVV